MWVFSLAPSSPYSSALMDLSSALEKAFWAEATALELAGTHDVAETRLPTDEELRLIREVLDPGGVRKAEFR